MKKIQVDFCNREQTVSGNKNWPQGLGDFNRDFLHKFVPLLVQGI